MQLPRGDSLRKLWLVGVVIYAALRAYTVDLLFSRYGVNGWVYFGIEMATSIPFGHYSAQLVSNLASGRSWKFSAIITLLTYVASDVYLMVALHSAPTHIYFITLAVVISLASLSAITIVRKRKRALV